MTPSARVQAAIDLLDLIIEAARDNGPAADTIIARWFKDRRYAGSKDRRAVRELVYRAIRAFGNRPESGRAPIVGLAKDDAALRALFDGSSYGPATIEPDEKGSIPFDVPKWLRPYATLFSDPAERAAMLARAPLDLRVNSLKASFAEAMAELDGGAPIDGLPNGIRLEDHPNLEASAAYVNGLVEVQDAGSQHVCLACDVKPGDLVVDLCAGAGGKTLALAAAMANKGRLIACDTDRRIQRLAPRAARSGVTIITDRLLNPNQEMASVADLRGQADLVLVDAPCSGTGTWRRNPEARWRVTPARLQRTVALQAHVLDLAAELVRPGGHLVYAVCSVLDPEGKAAISAFLERFPGWKPQAISTSVGRAHGDGLLLTPAHDATDGFFIAKLAKSC